MQLYKTVKTKCFTTTYLFGMGIYNSPKRVLLVTPHNHYYENSNPISILDIAPYLRARGMKVDVCAFPHLPRRRYDIIGISAIADDGGEIFSQIEAIRDRYKNQKIMLGGKWSTTLTPHDRARLEKLNIVVEPGKAELVFTDDQTIDFANYPSWNKNDFKVLCKEQNDEMMSSRGCPFNCNFCNNTEAKINYFSAKRTVDNIELLLRKNKCVFFVDDVFVTNYEHAKSIYDECKRRKIVIENRNRFFIHLNLVNDKTIELIRLFKPYLVQVGIESGDDEILTKMNKRITTDKIRNTVPILAEHAKVHGLWIVGYPYETEQSLENSYNLMQELSPYLTSNWVSHYVPLYGTKGWQMAQEEGGTFHLATNNRNVAYVPKALSADRLLEYREKMLAVSGTFRGYGG